MDTESNQPFQGAVLIYTEQTASGLKQFEKHTTNQRKKSIT